MIGTAERIHPSDPDWAGTYRPMVMPQAGVTFGSSRKPPPSGDLNKSSPDDEGPNRDMAKFLPPRS